MTPQDQQPNAVVELLHSSDCPHVSQTRALLQHCLEELSMDLAIREREGAYASPTILVNGADVMGRTDFSGAMCRLDLPTRDRVLAALKR